jgi:hypothetical protein
MELPTLPVLTGILADLEALPDSDPDKADAIAKVKSQIKALKDVNG